MACRGMSLHGKATRGSPVSNGGAFSCANGYNPPMLWLGIISDVLSIIGAVAAIWAWWHVGQINQYFRSRILVREAVGKMKTAIKNAREAHEQNRWIDLRSELAKAEAAVESIASHHTSLKTRAKEAREALQAALNADLPGMVSRFEGCLSKVEALITAAELFAKDKQWEAK